MLYMVQLHYSNEQRDAALRYFLEHGAIGYEGKVTLLDAWVATDQHVAYAIVKAERREEIDKACAPLEQFGEVKCNAVTSADQL